MAGVVANTLDLFRQGAIGFIDGLDGETRYVPYDFAAKNM